MNKFLGKGRFAQDIEVRYSQGENSIAIASSTVALDRKFKRDNEPTADFIRVKAFGKTAEFLEKYFSKGSEVCFEARVQTGSYEKDGVKHYTTDFIIENVEFCGSKSNNTSDYTPSTTASDGFMNVPDGIDEELPFK